MKSLVSGRARTGFTVTELLVAMALIVFIMAIISESFSAGASAFRNLKAIGDMAERLRSAAILLRRDLDETHFEATDFVRTSLITGKADVEEAAALREDYEGIGERAEALDVEFVCLPRPLERAPSDDGGPILYRVAHHVPRWGAGDTPQLVRRDIVGIPPLLA